MPNERGAAQLPVVIHQMPNTRCSDRRVRLHLTCPQEDGVLMVFDVQQR